MTPVAEPALPLGSAERIKLPLVVAGRTFMHAGASTTIDQDAYTSKRYHASGIAKMAQAFNPSTDDLGELSEKMLWEALESGTLYEILAGTFVEQGTRWSRESAKRNAAFFESLTARADKDVVFARMGDIVFDFLVVAALSGHSSESSSDAPPPPSASGEASELPRFDASDDIATAPIEQHSPTSLE